MSDSESSSSCSSEEISSMSVPSMIRASVAAGGSLKDAVTTQWILEEETGRSFRYHDNKIVCWVPAESAVYEWENGQLTQIVDKSKKSHKVARLSVVSKDILGTARDVDDDESAVGTDDALFIEIADRNIPGFKDFALRWAFDVKYLRRLYKCDKMLIKHLMNRFEPKKSKPKTALRSLSDSLLKYPQKWRLQSFLSYHSNVSEILLTSDDQCVIGSHPHQCDLVISNDDAISSEHCEVFQLQGDYYLQNMNQSFSYVDGIRNTAADGPIELKDHSFILIGESAIICEIGDKEWLDDRRSRFTEPPKKRIRTD